MTEGLVYPRLGIQFRKEPTVKIFVSEHELQRLMAKEEVKQEARSTSLLADRGSNSVRGKKATPGGGKAKAHLSQWIFPFCKK